MDHGFAFQFYNSGGGAPGSGVIVSDCTIVDGTGGRNGGSLMVPERSSNVKVVNSILAYNGGAAAIHFYRLSPRTGSNGDHLALRQFGRKRRKLERLDVEERADGGSALRRSREQELPARPRSPAISYSDTAYSPATDLDGTPRPAGTEDAGAYERAGG